MAILAMTLTIGSVAQQLPQGKPIDRELRVRTDDGNAGDSYLSDSLASSTTPLRYCIPADELELINVTEMSDLWLSGTAGDLVYLLAEIEA